MSEGKWTINELISHLGQEDKKMKQKKIESANLASYSKSTWKRKGKGTVDTQANEKQKFKGIKCFFYKDLSHVKKNCPKYHS